MKNVTIVAGIAGVALLGVIGVMRLTNPSQSAYEEYAFQRLTKVLKEDGCKKLGFGLQKQCPNWIDENQADLKQFVSQNTRQQDFFVVSVYTTDLSVRSLLPPLPFLSSLPSYHFETVGAFQNFYTYKATVQRGGRGVSPN